MNGEREGRETKQTVMKEEIFRTGEGEKIAERMGEEGEGEKRVSGGNKGAGGGRSL